MTLGDLKAAIQLAEEQGATDGTKVCVNGVAEYNFGSVVADTSEVEADYIPLYVYKDVPGGDSFWMKFHSYDNPDVTQGRVLQKTMHILGQ